MNKFGQLIYGSESLELSFEVTIDKAVERLGQKVSRTFLSRLTSQGMVGFASIENTRIERVLPFLRNSFKPVFVGSFRTVGDQTVLSGVLRLHRSVQVFMTFWFGFIALQVIAAPFTASAYPDEAWQVPLVGVLMFAFGIGLLKSGKRFSRNDKQWLVENITSAINQNS